MGIVSILQSDTVYTGRVRLQEEPTTRGVWTIAILKALDTFKN